jgi:hypothetical protein
MHYFFLLFALYSPAQAATAQEIAEAQTSIKALIAPLLPGAARNRPEAAEKFRVDACKEHKINWTEVLLMQKSVALDYSFGPGCDIQGQIQPKLLKDFPAKLDLRNLDHYNKIESQNKISTGIEAKPILSLEMRSGILSGKKGMVKFEADYQVRVDPFSSKKPVHENLGGEIRINEIYGKKTNIKEKIIVN